MSTTWQLAVVLIFFCDLFGVATQAGKRLKQSIAVCKRISRKSSNFFIGPLGGLQTASKRPPNGRQAGFSVAKVPAGHAETRPAKALKTHIHAPFRQ
ncbi:hypothetical protein [Paraburkholderia unamae]|uniref:Uncharacterized protein n=1 Tax=Paraburkholderia unamae TaxID=219649 RepID=A0ACC6RKY8_9BURK